ncbi:MAG: 50S ribosomal protein L1 [Candidatus Hydrothermarchaeaceae archaeon]
MVKVDSIVKGLKEMRSKTKKRKFNQGIDLVLALKDLDVNKPENRLNEELVLPMSRGRDVKLALIATGELALQGKKIMDKVITKKELEELGKDKKAAKGLASDYDFFIAQADLMVAVGKSMGSVLGPRGKMPKPVPPNADLKPLAGRLKKTIRIRMKETPIIQVSVGTEEMDDKSLAENIEAVLKYLEGKLARGVDNIRSVYIKATMGPSVKLEVL